MLILNLHGYNNFGALVLATGPRIGTSKVAISMKCRIKSHLLKLFAGRFFNFLTKKKEIVFQYLSMNAGTNLVTIFDCLL